MVLIDRHCHHHHHHHHHHRHNHHHDASIPSSTSLIVEFSKCSVSQNRIWLPTLSQSAYLSYHQQCIILNQHYYLPPLSPSSMIHHTMIDLYHWPWLPNNLKSVDTCALCTWTYFYPQRSCTSDHWKSKYFEEKIKLRSICQSKSKSRISRSLIHKIGRNPGRPSDTGPIGIWSISLQWSRQWVKIPKDKTQLCTFLGSLVARLFMFMFINETEKRGGCFIISDIIEISCKFFSADNVTTLIQVILDI